MTIKYGVKEYLEEYREALEGKPELSQAQTKKPNLLETLKSKTGLNRIRNERKSS